MAFSSLFLFTLVVSAEPCTKCHKTFNKTAVEKLILPYKEAHKELAFRHMLNKKKCLLCHSEAQPNQLVLLDGKLLSYDESPQLCGQCHGPVYFDWKEGIHGKLIAKGTVHEKKFLCINCHNPHDPKFKQMKAEPAPHRPKLIFKKQEEDEPHGN